jgi:phage head maturation protease
MATEVLDEQAEAAPIDGVVQLDLPSEELQTLSVEKRRLGLRIMPYGVVAEHPAYGALLFEPGAFGSVDSSRVRLRMDHKDPPTGLGAAFNETPEGAFMEFSVSRTQRGDEQLTLARDGVSRGASVGFREMSSGVRIEKRDGRQVRVYGPNSASLEEVSTTWQPTFAGAGVMYVLNRDQKGDGPMAEAQEAPVVGAIDYEQMANITAGAIDKVLSEHRRAGKEDETESKITQLLAKHDELIELQRAQFNVPTGEPQKKAKLHSWVEYTLRRMAGDTFGPSELKELALDDVVTTEQPGAVPSTFTADYDDLINADRPFLSSTREVAPPRTGTSMTLPIITVRSVAGTQAGSAEKGVLTTTATKVGTGTFPYQSVFGGADISIQMINRAEPSFFDVLTGDMAMAYALDAENKAIDALLAGYTDSASVAHAPEDGGTLDPENLELGEAWINSILVYKRAPDTIWLSATAVAAFIDAKASGSNAPLYSNLAAAFSAGTGAGGVLSGLRPIYVPALDDEDVDVIVGPSRGFVWAEDPARRLTADVPEKAGRDIVLAGGIFPAPRFADAFTTYVLASS